MIQKTFVVIKDHIKNNKITYIGLFIFYILGISAGSVAVNQLDYQQRSEMTDYFNGFLKLLDSSKVDGISLFKMSLWDNFRVILLLWVLGIIVIGFPIFYIIIGMRGFITGFSSGVIMNVLGVKGVLISFTCFLPKEVIIVPCLIAISVNGIKLSKSIIKGWIKRNTYKEDKLRYRIMPYSFVTVFFSIFVLIAIVLEAFFSPVILKLLSSI